LNYQRKAKTMNSSTIHGYQARAALAAALIAAPALVA
jgi:hypothetical protein